jgi:hypothetical protein
MKERQLAELCRRTWNDDGSEVTLIRLTPESRGELTQDIVGDMQDAVCVTHTGETMPTAGGATVTAYVHPITGREIPIKCTEAKDGFRDRLVLEREVLV